VLREGQPLRGERVVAFVARGPGRAAFLAGKKVGGAVERNRARRVLRAAWREVRPLLVEETDVVWVARASIRGTKTQDLVVEMTELLRRAGMVSR